MKKTIFLLLLLTSFTMMFGQIGAPRGVRLLVKGADNSMVTGPTNGVSVTNTATNVTTTKTMNHGVALFTAGAALTQGDTYTYDITPPACFVDQTHSTGSFLVEVTTDPNANYYIYATPFVGVSPVVTLTRTVNVDGAIPNSDVVVKITNHDVNGSNGQPGPDYIPYTEIIGTTTGDGIYTFANAHLGVWDAIVQVPCTKTSVTKSAINLNCTNYLTPPTSTTNVNTTAYPYSLGTGPGTGEILLTDCSSNYPIRVGDGNIINDTQYTVNYTYDNWGTPVTVTSPVVTSFPSYNSAPNWNNNNNRLQFTPEGYKGSLVTVNFLTQVGGSCADLIVDKSITNLGPPSGTVSFTDSSLSWNDPASITGGKLLNSTSGEEFSGTDQFGTFTFNNIPEGTYTATLVMTNCRVYTQDNITVTCSSILGGNLATAYRIDGSAVPALTSGKVVARMVATQSGDTCPLPVFDSAATATMTDGVNTVIGTLTFDNDFVFENVPFSATPYTITAVRPCFPDVTATYTVDCSTTLYSVKTDTGDPCYRIATEDGYGYTTLDYTGLSSSVAADFTVVMDMPFGTAYFSKAELSGGSGFVEGNTSLGNFATFSNIPFGTYTLYLDRNCYNQKVIEGIEISCATLTAAKADPENPFGTPYELVTYTPEDAKTTNTVVISPMFEAAILVDASVTLSSVTADYSSTVVTSVGWVGADPAYFYDVPYATDYTYKITYPCYATQEGTLTVDCNNNVEISMEVEMSVATTNDLYVNLGPIGGIGFGVYGATIRVYNADMSYDETIESSSDLNLFANVPYGEVTYVITQACKESVTGTTTVDCNEGEPDGVFVEFGANQTSNDLYVNLGPIGGIGFGVYGATIRVYNADMSYDETIESSSDLNLFANLPYGEYNYEVSQTCKETVTGMTTVDCNEGEPDGVFVEFGANQTTNDLYVNLGPVGGIGFGVYGATIRVYNADMSYDETIESSSDLNLFANVPYGEVTYVVSQACKESVTGTTTVDCNEGEPDGVFVEFGVASTTNDLYVNLGPVGGIGFGVYGATIRVYNADMSYDETIDSSSDLNLFANVPYGDVTYVITQACKESVTGTTTVDCNEGEADGVFVEFGMNLTTNDLYVNLGPVGGIGFGVYGATIRVYNADMSYDETIESSSDLNLFANVPYGDVTYEITQECKQTVTGTTTVDCNDGEADGVFVEFGAAFTSGQLDVAVSEGMLPLFGATVRIYNAELNYDKTQTATDFTTFTDVPYGDYAYEVSYTCKETAYGTVTIACNAENFTFLAVELNPATKNMLTLMIDNGTDPVNGVEVTISNEDGFSRTVFGVQGGMANFFNVPYGTINYSITGGDCVSPKTGTLPVQIDCNNGEPVSATISLDAATIGNLNLSVTDGTTDVSGATIHLFNTEASYDVTATSSGYNYFKNVPYGELSYEVSMEGMKTAMGTITIECALYNITEFQVVLEPALGVNDFNKNSFSAVSFPNPFVDNFAVKVTSLNQDKVNIKVYDIVGRLIEQRNTNVSDLETTQIGNNYPSGIYNVIVTQDKNVKTLRVIKR